MEACYARLGDEKIEVSIDDLSRLQTAAGDFARVEVSLVMGAIIDELRFRLARHKSIDVLVAYVTNSIYYAIRQRLS